MEKWCTATLHPGTRPSARMDVLASAALRNLSTAWRRPVVDGNAPSSHGCCNGDSPSAPPIP
eukprot:3661258-Pleurochrysis_carterae.AAC.1